MLNLSKNDQQKNISTMPALSKPTYLLLQFDKSNNAKFVNRISPNLALVAIDNNTCFPTAQQSAFAPFLLE
eukprot:scaffold34948_cov74-Cyclotella_meneghiniana.AAC.7